MDLPLAEKLARIARKQTVRLTHYGRKTGQPHDVTIWFATDGQHIYLSTANVNRHWVRNVQKTPQVKLSIADEHFEGQARYLTDTAERNRVIALVKRKYWPFRPFVAFGQLLARLGIVKDTVGSFEVTLQP
jgi:deazaflavin-dependent oxidoreductase (nitroreductase family)